MKHPEIEPFLEAVVKTMCNPEKIYPNTRPDEPRRYFRRLYCSGLLSGYFVNHYVRVAVKYVMQFNGEVVGFYKGSVKRLVPTTNLRALSRIRKDSSEMLIRELAYDTEADELDLLIDTFKPEPAEVIPIGNDIFLRRSIKNGKIVGATIANYSFWHPEPLAAEELKHQYVDVREHIIRYLTVKYKTAAAS